MQLFIILGAPRSGLNLLSDCLSLLGMASLADTEDAGVNPPARSTDYCFKTCSVTLRWRNGVRPE